MQEKCFDLIVGNPPFFDSSTNIHDQTSTSTDSSTLLLRILLPRNKGLTIARANAHVGKNLLWSEVNGGVVSRLIRNLLLKFLSIVLEAPLEVTEREDHTKLSKTHLLSFHSAGRHCHNWWFRSSRHSQCLRNSAKQWVLRSLMLLICVSSCARQ